MALFAAVPLALCMVFALANLYRKGAENIGDAGSRLFPTVEMFREKLFDGTVQLELVFFVDKTMPFVLFEHVRHFNTPGSQSRRNLISLLLKNSDVVLSVCDKEWCFDLLGVKHW